MNLRPRHLVPTSVAALVLGVAAVPPASAVVAVSGNYIWSDAAGDSIHVTCVGGKLYGPAGDPCATLVDLTVNAGAGTDTVDVSAVSAAAFPVLTRTRIDVTDPGGSQADSVHGSPFEDQVDGDWADTASTGDGNDLTRDVGTVNAGAGDDVVFGAGNAVSAGAGDDRIVQGLALLGIDGGTGHDTLEIDFDQTQTSYPAGLSLTFTAGQLRVVAGPTDATISVSGVEHVSMVMFRSGQQSFDGTTYPGTFDVRGLSGVDAISGGAHDDLLAGGSGNDTLTGGGGADDLRAGDGDDLVQARDGVVDEVDCGTGSDTVVADAGDLLVGCETVQLPPVVTPPAPVAPETGAVDGPRKVRKPRKATFRFSSATVGATFQCRLDARPWKTCASPHRLATKRLKAGRHTLQVRAVVAGVVDPTPSRKRFKVR